MKKGTFRAAIVIGVLRVDVLITRPYHLGSISGPFVVGNLHWRLLTALALSPLSYCCGAQPMSEQLVHGNEVSMPAARIGEISWPELAERLQAANIWAK